MSAIDEHICELLYDHDCVIVPSLGGFLASNVQANLNPAQHTILPPRRKIAFNIYLRQNDGLLANHLVEYDRVSYPEAIQRIEAYVQDCFSKLDQHRKVIVERVGTIYYDKEKHLLFEPFRQSQFRKDAFGLGSIQFLPIDREDSGNRIEKQRRELMKARPSVKSGRIPVAGRKFNYKMLGVLAIAGTLLWFSFNLFLIKPGGGTLGSLNPFSSDTNKALTSVTTENANTVVAPPAEKQEVETVFVASTEPLAEVSDTHAPKTEESALSTLVESETSPTASTYTDESATYHVIAGAFKIPENAEGCKNSLHSKGFTNAHIIHKGILNYVSYNSFSDRTSALALLDSLRKQNAEGWIWHN